MTAAPSRFQRLLRDVQQLDANAQLAQNAENIETIMTVMVNSLPDAEQGFDLGMTLLQCGLQTALTGMPPSGSKTAALRRMFELRDHEDLWDDALENAVTDRTDYQQLYPRFVELMQLLKEGDRLADVVMDYTLLCAVAGGVNRDGLRAARQLHDAVYAP